MSYNAPCLPAQTEKDNGKEEFLADIHMIEKAHDKKCPENANGVGEYDVDIIRHIMKKQHYKYISRSNQPYTHFLQPTG